MYNFKTNELIEAVLYSKRKISSWIKYRRLLWKIRRSTPDYKTLLVIYEFIDQLNFAYFHSLTDTDHLFINDSRKNKKDEYSKSLMYKDKSNGIELTVYLKEYNSITLHIKRNMGYMQTSITFADGQLELNNPLEEQLFINCTNLIMNELYRMIKKYRKFGRLK